MHSAVCTICAGSTMTPGHALGLSVSVNLENCAATISLGIQGTEVDGNGAQGQPALMDH